MKILFSTFGSLGDIHPYIAIAFEAKNRGHEPVFATAPKYRAKIESLGFEFRPIRPDLPPDDEFGPMAKRVMNLKDGPRYLFQDVLMPALQDSYRDLMEAIEDVDLFISHPAVPAGPIIGQKTGKKWMSSTLAPISMWSKYDPPVPPTAPQLDFLRVLGPLWSHLLFSAGKAGTASWIRDVEMLFTEVGVDTLGHPMFEGQYSPHGTLALFSPRYAAPQRDWPNNSTATGFCFYDAAGYKKANEADGVEPEEWKDWINQGEPPVVFALGSAAVFNADEFWQRSAESIGPNHRAVLLTGGQKPFADGSLPDNMLEVEYAPYSELFPLAKFVVHQGGIGTTAQVLRAGVPQIVVPHAHDQPDNAARISRLKVGYGVSLRSYLRSTPRCLQQMFTYYPDHDRWAHQLGHLIRSENGPLQACRAMERVFDA